MIKPKPYAMAAGVLWGVAVLLVTWISVLTTTGYGEEFLMILSSIYPGYEITMSGGIVGLVWGFVDGFVGVWLFIWLVNFFSKRK